MNTKSRTNSKTQISNTALVPKLRFPEFRGKEVWHEGKIADIAVSESSSRALNKLSLKSEGYPVYGADSCVGFIDSFDQADDYIAIVKDGSGVGRLSLKRGKSSVLGTLAYIKCKPRSETKLTWLYYCLNSLDLRQFIKGSGIPHIYFSDYASHEVLIPTPSEQQKIAECLSSMDELMAAQARKVDALKTHKKGLMQQLFPRESETQPRLRFPEFQNAGEWRRELLGSLCSRIMDGTHFSPKSKEGPRPYLTSKNIKDGRINLSNLSYISDDEHAEIYSKCPVKLNDVLLTKDGANTGNCALNNLDFEFSLLSSVAVLRGNPSKLRQEFLFQSILSDATQSLIAESMAGQAITRITLAKLGGFMIPVTSLDEQQRIARCLGSLDAQIAAETQKHEALKTHKKGLMQQLFPAAAEAAA